MPISVRHCSVAVAIAFAAPVPVLAQQSVARYELNLPEQELADSLRALGKAAHVNIVFEPSVVAGRRAPALPAGKYTLDEAMNRLLAGSGVDARRTEGGSYVVEPRQERRAADAPASSASEPGRSPQSAQTLQRVVITGKVQGFSATRAETDLKDVPQSVTVISQQTLQEQNANDLSTAFQWAPGITLERNNSTNNVFYSRGFEINTVHIDGGGPLELQFRAGQLNRIDLSQYESIEVLRGADALFGGAGKPGGSINLARKRPLPDRGVSLTASAGSWDAYRIEADINTGKITDSGRLRGRMVAVSESEHYFYNTAQRRANKLYAVAEYDLMPRTQMRVGGSIERTPEYVPFQNGLPRYADGSDPHLPRSTALTFPWVQNSATSKEGFLQLDHAFNERWKLKAGITHVKLDQSQSFFSLSDAINPVTQTINLTAVSRSRSPLRAQQTATDITLAGSFDWNGRAQDVMFGFDAKRKKDANDNSVLFGTPIDPFGFDPSTYPQPTTVLASTSFTSSAREHGVFASIRLRPADGWALTAGARSTSSSGHQVVQTSVGPFQLPAIVTDRSSSGVITPFLGAVYEISPIYSLYASYADTSEGYASQSTASGQILDPARGTNKEIGLKAAWDRGRLNGSLALFDIRRTDVAVLDPATPPVAPPSCCYISTTERSKGFEAELNGRLAPGWQLGSGYTFNSNHAGDGSSLSTITPKHLFKLWTNYRLPGEAGAWNIGGGIIAQTKNYRMGRACTAFNPATGACTAPLAPFRVEQGAYSVVSLRAGYRVNDHWDLALNIDNLFDRNYYQTIGKTAGGNWYGAPRNWKLTLRGTY